MQEICAELRRLQKEFESGRRLRAWTKRLLRGTSERTRSPDEPFDGPDALDGDLWWLAGHPVHERGLARVFADPSGRCVACEDRRELRGVWLERRENGMLIVTRDDQSASVGWWGEGATYALFADIGRWWTKVTLEPSGSRPERITRRQGSDAAEWGPPYAWDTVIYDDEGAVLAYHARYTVDKDLESEQMLFERPVQLPGDDELMRRSHDDLVAACRAALASAGPPLAGARLWQLHDDHGARNAYSGIELCRTLDDLLGAPPETSLADLDLPVIAPWSRQSFVRALEERLVGRAERDALDALAVAVVREVNEHLEREHGAQGPVLLRCVGWLHEDEARPGLTDAQWARWEAEDWTSRIASFEGMDDPWEPQPDPALPPIAVEILALRAELEDEGYLRAWIERALRDGTRRVREPTARFDGPDAADGDAWWRLGPQAVEPDGLVHVWSGADGRCLACEDRRELRGVWFEPRDEGAVIVLREEEVWIAWVPDDASEALIAGPPDLLLRGTIASDHGRPAGVTWHHPDFGAGPVMSRSVDDG